MKKFSKLLASLMAVATLGTTLITPISASAIYVKKVEGSAYEEIAIKEATVVVEDGEYSGTYYLIDGWIYVDDTYTVNDDYKLIDESIDTSNFETIYIDMTGFYTAEVGEFIIPNFCLDAGSSYEFVFYGGYGSWGSYLSSIPKQDTTVEEPVADTPIEEPTIGTSENEKNENGLYSTPTEVRGDVNYDGLVNNIDVMVLRKYILHLIEW